VVIEYEDQVKGYARFWLGESKGKLRFHIDTHDGSAAHRYYEQIRAHIVHLAEAIGLSDKDVVIDKIEKVGGTLTSQYYTNTGKDLGVDRKSFADETLDAWKPKGGWGQDSAMVADDRAMTVASIVKVISGLFFFWSNSKKKNQMAALLRGYDQLKNFHLNYRVKLPLDKDKRKEPVDALDAVKERLANEWKEFRRRIEKYGLSDVAGYQHRVQQDEGFLNPDLILFQIVGSATYIRDPLTGQVDERAVDDLDFWIYLPSHWFKDPWMKEFFRYEYHRFIGGEYFGPKQGEITEDSIIKLIEIFLGNQLRYEQDWTATIFQPVALSWKELEEGSVRIKQRFFPHLPLHGDHPVLKAELNKDAKKRYLLLYKELFEKEFVEGKPNEINWKEPKDLNAWYEVFVKKIKHLIQLAQMRQDALAERELYMRLLSIRSYSNILMKEHALEVRNFIIAHFEQARPLYTQSDVEREEQAQWAGINVEKVEGNRMPDFNTQARETLESNGFNKADALIILGELQSCLNQLMPEASFADRQSVMAKHIRRIAPLINGTPEERFWKVDVQGDKNNHKKEIVETVAHELWGHLTGRRERRLADAFVELRLIEKGITGPDSNVINLYREKGVDFQGYEELLASRSRQLFRDFPLRDPVTPAWFKQFGHELGQLIFLLVNKDVNRAYQVLDLMDQGVSLQDAIRQAQDKAMNVANKGGIDLSAKTPLEIRGEGQIKFVLDPRQLKQLQDAQGFIPVILSIQPITDIKGFLGLNLDNPAGVFA